MVSGREKDREREMILLIRLLREDYLKLYYFFHFIDINIFKS